MFAVYKKLLYYVPKQRPLAYIAIGLTVVSTLLNVGAYYYLYEFLKRLVVDGDMGHAQYNAFLVAGLLIGGSLLYFAAVLLTHMLGFRLETNLRKRGIDGLTNASFRYFDLNSSGKTRIAVFFQRELAVPTGVQVSDQRFHDRAPVVFIPDARIDGLLVGRNVGLFVLLRPCFGERHDLEQVTTDRCVFAKCDVGVVKRLHIVKADAPSTISTDQIHRPLFTPLEAGVGKR